MEHPYYIKILNLVDIGGKKIPVGQVVDEGENVLLTFNFPLIVGHYLSIVERVQPKNKEQFKKHYEEAKQNLIIRKNISKDNITKTVTIAYGTTDGQGPENDIKETIVLQFAEIAKIPANTENIIDEIKLLANDFIANPENYPISDGGAYTGIPLEMIDDNEE